MFRIFFSLLFFFFLFTVSSQTNTSPADSFLTKSDSLANIHVQLQDSLEKIKQDGYRRRDSIRNVQNLDQFMAYQKEQRAKQKRNAYIRIGIGVLFLIVLIIGLRRRKKSPKV